MSSTPEIARKGPYAVEVEAGKTYYWCACGRSANQPFCDGSHAGSQFVPVEYTPQVAGSAYLCGCKRSAGAPMCDGTHQSL